MNYLQRLDKKALAELNALNSEVLKLLEGIDYNTDPSKVNDLVIKAFGDVGYSAKMQEIIMGKSVEAAAFALGDKFAIASVDEYIAFELAKTYDGVKLSEIMRDNVVKTQQEVTSIIKKQLDIGTTWKKLSSEIQQADKVSDVARIITDMGKLSKQSNLPRSVQSEISAEIRKAQTYVKQLSQGNAPTKPLKKAYDNVIKAALTNDKAAVQTALERAAKEKIVYNADRIARTEISGAYNNAFMTQIDEDEDITGFEWVLSDDHPVVDECDIYANIDNGAGKGIYRKGDFPSLPAHPNCVIGETMISFISPLNKVYNAIYSGDVVKITLTNGERLYVTANHPVLTQRGFIKACFLNNGDKVIKITNGKWVSPFVINYDNTFEASATDIFEAVNMSSGVPSVTMPLTSEDFHGDAKFFNEDVNIINANGFLLSNIKTTRTQSVSNNSFSVTNTTTPASLNTLGSVFKVRDTFFGTSDGLVRFGGDFGEKFGSAIFGKPFDTAIGCCFNSNTGFFKDISYNTSTYTDKLAYFFNGNTGLVLFDDLSGKFISVSLGMPLNGSRFSFENVVNSCGMDSELRCNLALTKPFFFEIDDIVEISTCHFDNLQVYNFETDNTNIYNGNGVVLHNCLCSMVPVVIDIPRKTSQATLNRFLEKQTESDRAKMIGVKESKHKSLYAEGLKKHGIDIKNVPDKLPVSLITKT